MENLKYFKYFVELGALLLVLLIAFVGMAILVYRTDWGQMLLTQIFDIRAMIELGVFSFIGTIIIGLSILTVYSRNIVHSALYLLGTFGGVAVLYLILNAPFVGVAQVLVYIGAVGVLILFAVMLTRRTLMEESHG
jgi:NADH-quinone oxidoreductase subunit J